MSDRRMQSAPPEHTMNDHGDGGGGCCLFAIFSLIAGIFEGLFYPAGREG